MDQHKKHALTLAIDRLEANLRGALEATATFKAILLDKPADEMQLAISEFDYNDPRWPAAVPAANITADSERAFRAKQIVALIRERTKESLIGKRVLDFGSGEGHVAREIAAEADTVVGYDIVSPTIEPYANMVFTVDRQQLDKFDLVVMYDVLDHIDEDPADVMAWVGSLLKPGGKIFIRTHPWTSRHGGHLYELMNKAFVHLVMDPKELENLVEAPKQRVNRPMGMYEKWFRNANLKVISRKPEVQNVEDYFHDKLLRRIMENTWEDNIDESTALKIMAIQHIDYVLGEK